MINNRRREFKQDLVTLEDKISDLGKIYKDKNSDIEKHNNRKLKIKKRHGKKKKKEDDE